MTKQYQDDPQDEPLFITEEIEAELLASCYEFRPPNHLRTKNICELFGWRPGETLSEGCEQIPGAICFIWQRARIGRRSSMTTEAEALANILAWSADSPGWQRDALRRFATQAAL